MTCHQLLRMRDSHCKRGRDRLAMDVDVGESDGEQHDLDVSAPEEHGGEVFEDGGGICNSPLELQLHCYIHHEVKRQFSAVLRQFGNFSYVKWLVASTLRVG